MSQILALFYAASGFLSIGVATRIGRRWREPFARFLALAMLANALWCVGVAFELLSSGPDARQLWATAAFLGRTGSPPLALAFALHFSQLPNWLAGRRIVLFLAPLILAIMLTLTDPWHRWLLTDLAQSLATLPGLPGYSPLSEVMLLFSYGVLVTAMVILLQDASRLRHVYREQAVPLAVALFLPPLTGNLLSSANPNPWLGSDLTLLALACAGILILLSMSWLHALGLRPVHRDVLVEQMGDAVLLLDVQGRIADMNAAAWTFLGFAAAPIGRPALAVLPPGFPLPAAGEEFAARRSEFVTHEDPPRHLDVRMFLISPVRGVSRDALIVWREVTEQRRAQEMALARQCAATALEERERSAATLDEQLAHVWGYLAAEAQSIQRLLDADAPAAAAARLAALQVAARRAADNPSHRFEPDPFVDVETELPFFAELKRYLRRYQDLVGVQIRLSLLHPGIGAQLSTENRLHLLRILQDALANVQQHARAHMVQVILALTSDMVELVVADDGVGFAYPEALALAAPEAAGESDARGGIARMTQRAAGAGGRLQVWSAPDKGTSIILTLPRLQREEISAELKALRLLLVDDHPLVLQGMLGLLEDRGMTVVGTADDGETAIEKALALQPDLILMDVSMPRLSGPEAVRRIKAVLPHVRIVMLSVSSDGHHVTQSLAAGAEGYLLKGQSAEEFFSGLAQVARGDMALAAGLAAQVARNVAESPSVSVQAMSRLLAIGLSPLQVDILRRVAKGDIYRRIALDLGVSESSIKYHMDRVYTLLNLSGRAEAVAYAVEIGLAQR
jgi:DNA-binding NarL/FixJ family response regulator/signal transduction histidine kinase